MRVLLLANAYPSERHPGFGSFVARAAAALEAQGHEVERAVLTTRARGRVRTPLKYAELAARGLIASRRRPDVIWAHYLVPTGSIARLVGRARRVPYAITAHGTDVANAEAGGRIAQATATVVRDAAAVIAVSPDLAGRLDALYGPLGERLHAISTGVDLDRFADGDRDVAAAALGWVPERPAYVFVGNLVAVKNLTRLLEAFASLGQGALALVGDGPERAALQAKAAALGIAGRVTITGEVSSPEVARWFRAADVVALVSEREGFGLVAVEGLATGRPVALTRSAGAASLVEDGVTGVLCDPGSVESIAAALRRAAALEPGAAARAAVEPYSVAREAGRLAEVLESIRRPQPA